MRHLLKGFDMSRLHFCSPRVARSAWVAFAVGTLGTLGWSRDAQAISIAVDGGATIPVRADQKGIGAHVGLRLGQKFSLPLIAFTPEIGADYRSFGALKLSDPTSNVWRAIGGLRVSVGTIWVPSVYAHIGYARTSTRISDPAILGAPAVDVRYPGLTLDAGLAFDFTGFRFVSFGVHSQYATGGSSHNYRPVTWIDVGAHVALTF